MDLPKVGVDADRALKMRLRRHLSLDDLKAATGWSPDGWRDDHWIGLTSTVHNARDLRAVLLNMAYVAAADPGSQVLYVLLRSRMSTDRIDQEVERFKTLMAPHIGTAIRVFGCEHTNSLAIVGGLPSDAFRSWLQRLISDHLTTPHKSSSREAVVGLLFLLFFLPNRTTSAAEIGALSGASHPTVASVLKELSAAGAIAREHGKVTLKEFPSTRWSRWVADAANARKRVMFAVGATRAASIPTLLRRLQEMKRADIAIGGTLAAHHYGLKPQGSKVRHVELSLHGMPSADLSFVETLDSTLARTTKEGNARLTINFLQAPKTFFQTDDHGALWTDPVTCLIDLYAARNTQQAEGVPLGQTEASAALGFGFAARMTYFVLPQALKAMVPSLISQFVSIVKDTSLGYVISVNELTFVANQLNYSLLTRPFEVFGILAITYFILCFSLASLARLADIKLGNQSKKVLERSEQTSSPKSASPITESST